MRADARLALPAAVGWIVLGVLIAFPSVLGGIAIALWILAGSATVVAMAGRARLRSGTAALALGCTVTALLLSCAALTAASRTPAALQAAAQTNRVIGLTAVTGVVRHPGEGRMPLPVTLTAVTVGAQQSAVRVPAVLFSTSGTASGYGLGTRLEMSGRVVAAEPGDSAAFFVFARGVPRVGAGPPWYLDWANRLRSRFLATATALPGDGGDLLAGLSIGDTSAVGATLDADLKAASLSHLTAVSGANCAVVIGLVMLAGGALGIPRSWRIGVCLVVLVGFVTLVTPQASVLRSAVMAALVLVALARGRPLRGVPLLSLAVVILLAVDPWLSRDYGFVLSVLATAGLLVLAGPLAAVLARWLPRALAAVIAIPLAAQLACQPVLILLDSSIPVYGVVANLLSEPAAPLATVLGLIACVLLPLAAPVGWIVAAAAWVPSAWIAAVARYFAGLPGSRVPWVPGMLGLALLGVVTLLLLFAVLGARGASRLRGGIALGLVILLVGYSAAFAGAQVRRQLSRPSDWQIAVCDVGQGDAVLVRSAGYIGLIDTGPDPVRLQGCLRQLRIEHIDLLVLTHYDLDHIGGTPAVLGRVERALVGPVSDAGDTRLRRALAQSGASVEQVAQGLTGRLGELGWRVLWPPQRAGSLEPGNAASVTVSFEGIGHCPSGCLSSVFLGDLGREPQARVLAVNRLGPVDVVKVAHHGSADQYEQMYRRLAARVGLIGVGAGNKYGHPTRALLRILSAVGTAVGRTDRQGMILVSPAPDGAIRLWSEREPN